MFNLEDSLLQTALDCGATKAAIVDTGRIQFSEELRNSCSSNRCGKYNSNWMCPPAVGDFKELSEKVKSYPQGLLVQTIVQLEDSFDIEGMEEGASAHNEMFMRVRSEVISKYPAMNILALNAGPCPICDQCTYPDNEPCRFPDRAIASVESHGIFVTQMVKCCGLKYNNGEATVSYVGVIFYK